MKTKLLLFVSLFITISAFADIQLYGPVTPPAFGGTYCSMFWGSSRPPLPCIPLQFINSDVYGIVGWTNHFVYDDTSDPTHSSSEMMTMETGGGDSGGDDPQPMYDYEHDFTNLWLSVTYITNVIENVTNLQAAVVMHNTLSIGSPYEVFSTTDLNIPMSNWVSEGIWIAYSTNTPANIDVGDRTNQNFFRARLWNGQFTYGTPKGGELFLLLPDTNAISAVVNDFTNNITPFYSNWAMVRLPATNGNILQTYNFNAGYSHDDSGDTNYLKDFPQQNIRAFLGFSATASNVALSFNAITNIDVRNWPKLYDLECWHTTNLLSAKVTGCPQLHRICFESIDDQLHGIQGTIDFTGCTNLADVRCADNALTNIVLGGAGPKIFHFCTRDNHNAISGAPKLPVMPFDQMPSLKELWVWRDYAYVQPLIVTATNSWHLTSVEAFANYFYTADFTGQTNLDHIFMESMPSLTNITIAGCSNMTVIHVNGDSLPTSTVDSILTNLDAMGLHNTGTYLDVEVQGNQAPSANGMRSVFNLLNKGWNVFYTPPPSGTPAISSVAVSTVLSNSATITWTTDLPSDSTVFYSADGVTYSSTNIATTTTSHSVTVTGLSVYTTYDFYVHSTSGSYTGTCGDSQFTTRGGPGIYFANSSGNVNMQVRVTGSPTVTWYWGDGSTSSGTTTGSRSISAGSTNYVSVVPASALTGFGVACGNSYNTTLTSVWGLTNSQNLSGIFLYTTALANLSLAGCTNLTYAALVGCTNVTTATANAWFNDLADAQVNISHIASGGAMCSDPNKNFFCPAGKVDSGSATSRSILTGKDWVIQFF